jgi:hypothetical protein
MVAVLIREITRRTGRGWPTILLLVAAGPLVATVAASFFVVDPLGDASSAERYLSNTILLAGSSPCWRRRGAGPAGHNRVSPPLMNPTAAAAGS